MLFLYFYIDLFMIKWNNKEKFYEQDMLKIDPLFKLRNF